MEKGKFLEAGQLVNTHGVRGEVKITPWADSPEFLKKIKTLYIGPDKTAYSVLSSRVHAGFLVALLDGVDDINAAMALKGKTVYIDRSDVRLPRGRFFIADLIGARVIDESGAELGTVADVMEAPAQRIYVVRGETEHLIPDVPEFILSVDPEAGLVRVHLIEGM